MAAWSARINDTDVHNKLTDIAQQQAALGTISNLAPAMMQPPPPKAPLAVHTFLKQQRDTRRAMIEALEAEITTLNGIHNAVFPHVTSLPSEMLAEIFSYLNNHHPGQRTTSDFSNAMAVCKKWRNVGCGVARFWTRIPLHNPNLLMASLERSRSLPLVVYLAERRCTDVQIAIDVHTVIELLQPHMGRIQVVDISHPDRNLLTILCSALNRPAAKLKTLRIRYSELGGKEVVLSPPFGGNMPALYSLALDRVLLTPNGVWLSNLQELSLRDTLPSFPEMLALLDKCTSLRTLFIDGYHMWDDDDNDPANQLVVSFPSLETLDVRTQPIVASEDLFAHLSLPENAAVRLEVDMDTDDVRPIPLPDLQLSHDIPCVQGLKRIEVLWQGPSSIIIRGFRNAQNCGRPNFEVVIKGASDFLDLPDEWGIDTSDVEVFVLRLGGMGEMLLDMWDILLKFPKLTKFRLIEPDVATLMCLIAKMTQTVDVPDRPGQRAHRLCRYLQVLDLVDFQWADEIVDTMRDMMVGRQTLEPRALRHVDMHHCAMKALNGRFTVCTPAARQGVVVSNTA